MAEIKKQPDQDCPLCQRLADEDPFRVLNSRAWVGVLDPHHSQGSCLLIPKRHVASFAQLDRSIQLIGESFSHQLEMGIMRALDPDYVEVTRTIRRTHEIGMVPAHCYYQLTPVYSGLVNLLAPLKIMTKIMDGMQ